MDQEQFQRYAQNVLERFFSTTRDPDKLYVLQPASSGDLLISGMLCYTLLPRFKKRCVVLFTQERYKALDVQFDGVSELRYLNHIDMWIVAQYFHQTKRYIGDRYFFAYIHQDGNGKNIVDENLSLVDMFKHEVFNVTLDTPLHYPVIREISEDAKRRLHQKYTIDKKRTVIIAPMSSSGLHISADFWFRLINTLNEKYIVYNNVGKTPSNTYDQPFPNALPLDVSHNELAYILKKSRCLIGLRSGLMDILSFTEGHLICMIKRDWSKTELQSIFPQAPARICSLYYDLDFLQRLNTLMDEFNIETMSIGNIKHQKLDSICWTEETLRDAILNEVERAEL